MQVKLIGLILALAAALVSPAQAQGWFSDYELRGGILAHSVDDGMFNASRIEDLNVELLIGMPGIDEAVRVGRFRPHVGGTFNLGGLESMVYAGVSWTVPIFDTPFFVEASLGGALHNGDIDIAVHPRRNLGCRVLFRESVSLGYNITQQASIMLTAEHASHASMCSGQNQGLTNLGVRIGWRF